MNQLAQNTVPEERVEELEAQLAALTEGVEALRKEQCVPPRARAAT